MSEGILVAVSGFSGAGKGTLMKELLKKYDQYALSISATTRQPRPGERDGVEYFFKTSEEFRKMIAEDAFIEYARYVDNYYGTPRSYVDVYKRQAYNGQQHGGSRGNVQGAHIESLSEDNQRPDDHSVGDTGRKSFQEYIRYEMAADQILIRDL